MSTNTYASFRVQKVRKGYWVYGCELCGVEGGGPDLFRAVEVQQRHEKTFGHMFAGIVAPFKAVAEMFTPPPSRFPGIVDGRYKPAGIVEHSMNNWQSGSRCHSNMDGDCSWILCPQTRDDEPRTSGRHCPLDVQEDD